MPEREARVIFQPMNRVLTVPGGTLLLDAMRTAGLAIESVCGGKGTCRKCRVILTRGKCKVDARIGGKRLTAAEEAKGYYMACQVRVVEDCEFTIPVESRIDSPQILLSATVKIDRVNPAVVRYPVETMPSIGPLPGMQSIRLTGYTGARPHVPDTVYQQLRAPDEPMLATLSLARIPPEITGVEAARGAGPLYGVAVDLGTTTVVGCLVDLQSGQIVGTGSALNRQITYGEELMTRIGYASTPAGLEEIRKAAVESVDQVINSLAEAAGIRKTDIVDMCLAGNTVMHHLFLGMAPRYLELANADVSRVPVVKKAASLGLSLRDGATVFCLPGVSRFVGGDAIGDVLASNMYCSDEISLVVDLGTNGEIILGNKDWMVSVSCASGPAFEGAGATYGVRAMKGAIDHVSLDPATSDVSFTTIGGVPPRGICGSGIIDAVAAMVTTGALDFAGKLNSGHSRVRPGEEGLEYVLVPAGRSAIGRDIVITQQDIDYLMDTKAAVCGAIGVLLNKCKLKVTDVRQVYLAGAFGAYTNLASATKLGIIPEFPRAEVHPIGNGSLSGAYATLVSRSQRVVAEEIARKIAYVDLMVDSEFFEEYLAALYIPGKRELFPVSYGGKGTLYESR
ncbi:predicted corrinoid activation/regeneration protein [Methanocella arvoryzae MRE50]|uniref:Predicted corrinoid activation/regeneration protein n=1 Tax=Methanocella arvoryzae (strain DSM 22066 / NBRC 105507 / MRE50) TaxID=351160 RepID=Q0W878_METAR|nr:predicted corrinoid activation/regeneration protein [Methanocella arvoryzae MRE50]